MLSQPHLSWLLVVSDSPLVDAGAATVPDDEPGADTGAPLSPIDDDDADAVPASNRCVRRATGGAWCAWQLPVVCRR